MRIPPPGLSPSRAPVSKRRIDQKGEGFAGHLEAVPEAPPEAAPEAVPEAPPEAATASPTAIGSVASLGPLLAVQAYDQQERQQGLSYGGFLLESLGQLHLALLSGQSEAALLEKLPSLAQSLRPQIADARLMEILDEIELRIAVERSKSERSS